MDEHIQGRLIVFAQELGRIKYAIDLCRDGKSTTLLPPDLCGLEEGTTGSVIEQLIRKRNATVSCLRMLQAERDLNRPHHQTNLVMSYTECT